MLAAALEQASRLEPVDQDGHRARRHPDALTEPCRRQRVAIGRRPQHLPERLRIRGRQIHPRRHVLIQLGEGHSPTAKRFHHLDRDDDRWRWHTAVQGRQIHLRPDPYGTIRAILAYSPGDDVLGRTRDETLALVRARYADAGWEAPRILDALATSPDVYVDQLQQVRMTTWHRGHVVMAGDAAWCVTPMGGGGASLALTAGRVLAAELAATDDRDAALAAYEAWLRPLVDDVQDLPRGLTAFAHPQTRVGLTLRRVVDRVMTSRAFRPMTAKLTAVAETDRTLPPLTPR